MPVPVLLFDPEANTTTRTTAATPITHGHGPRQNDLFARGTTVVAPMVFETALSMDALPKMPPTTGDDEVAGVDVDEAGRPWACAEVATTNTSASAITKIRITQSSD